MPDASRPDREICLLLLEDSEIDAELLAAHLNKAQLAFRLTRVVNRREFVAALEEGACEVILADYSLPDFDGLSALNIARALQPDIPFIFVSGVVGEEFATNALKRGATDYIMKRNLTRLATAVERALDQARERRERREAEQALSRSEMRARLAIEGAELGLWDFDPRSGEMSWDERCRVLLALGPDEEPTFDAWLARLHPDDRERLADSVADAITYHPDKTGAYAEEYRIVSPDGRERWIASRGQAQFEQGICTRFVGIVRDINEERLAQEALRRLTGDLERQVAERTAERDRIWRLGRDLFTVAGLDGRLRRVNPAWLNQLGYHPDALVGSDFSLLIHADDIEALGGVIKRLSEGEVIERHENRLRHANGTWRWISWTAVPEGEAFYAIGRDITEERAAAEALAQRNRELAEQIEERERVEQTLRQMQRLEAVGQLTSGVAHDFNNLLTVILGNISFVERWMSKESVDGKIADRIGHMRTAAERGAKLTAQMLAFSRKQKLEPKPLDLNETVGGMRDLLQSTLGGSVRLETVLKPDLWPALVDPTQIELIILNLAINARDAMEVGGGLTVETANVTLRDKPSRPEEPMPGEYVLLAVSDTGPGMSDEVLAKAFEPFFTTKEIGKGSGLGLAQVYGFAKQSGGGVRIETKLGEGATVKVFLPRAAARASSEPERKVAPRDVVSASTRNVLVMDDDSAVREITAAMLTDLGFTVIEAGSGSAALDVLRTDQRIDILLADYAMPGMNGVEAARAAVQMRPGLPVLFITGYADLKALRDVGEDRIIQKPFRDDELSRKVEAALADAAELAQKVVPLRRG
ncbi:response regulator [Phenylobacterium deserti]|uniref:histidine kinase n=1 Tax=Phenylobacterium deserti TaxID=1914756 RepID=A0A328AGA7_9CAUL|nr:response regulator [Phenylobacterium deserti]RAK52474.1 hybrid sensor histidine kinase/response regulator [Phenylobacterium deserti]